MNPYHGLRREELCKLRVRDLQQREGILHLRIEGKGAKIRFVPVAAKAARLIQAYLDGAGHGDDLQGPLFRPVKNNPPVNFPVIAYEFEASCKFVESLAASAGNQKRSH